MASRLHLAVALLALAGAQALPKRIPVNVNIEDTRIVGGDETAIENFPHQVALYYYGTFRCGGSIISDTFVLTAAHCLIDVRGLDWEVTVRAGSTSRLSGGQLVKAAKTAFEPSFTLSKLDRDVGIVKLKSPLTFNDAVRAVQLVPVGYQLKPGETVTLSGWGVLKENSKTASVNLRTTTVGVVRHWVCSISYALTAHITDNMFCASARGKDACQGDSGSAAINEDGAQVGIVSFANGCANWLFPGVYTSIASPDVRRFIDEQLEQI